MNTNNSYWNNCSNEEILDTLADCPEIVDELKKMGYQDLVNSYDAILPKYNMDRVTNPVYKDNSDTLDHFSYWYRIDSQMFDLPDDQGFKTKAEAQLASIRETMYELRKRIVSSEQ